MERFWSGRVFGLPRRCSGSAANELDRRFRGFGLPAGFQVFRPGLLRIVMENGPLLLGLGFWTPQVASWKYG